MSRIHLCGDMPQKVFDGDLDKIALSNAAVAPGSKVIPFPNGLHSAAAKHSRLLRGLADSVPQEKPGQSPVHRSSQDCTPHLSVYA